MNYFYYICITPLTNAFASCIYSLNTTVQPSNLRPSHLTDENIIICNILKMSEIFLDIN